jgi:hypothetical protein
MDRKMLLLLPGHSAWHARCSCGGGEEDTVIAVMPWDDDDDDFNMIVDADDSDPPRV